jgi:hypothetical protein
MNYFIITSAVVATMANIGHFAMGNKEYLKPVMNSNAAEIPKKVMQSAFHYMSVYMVLTAVLLIAFSFGENLVFENRNDVLKVIGFSYAGFAAVQFIIAITSSIKMGIFKLFQWIIWVLISVFALLGAY